MNRSYLFVPADSERKMKRAGQSGADAVILDLEDAVATEARPAARQLARAYIEDQDDAWVRINPIDSDDASLDLEAVMPASPVGIVLPKPNSADDVVRLAERLDALEAANGIEIGRTRVLPICTETPRAVLALGSYGGDIPRLAAMTWGAEDLSAAIGATANRDDDGSWLPPYELARSMCLFAAAAAQVPAVDTVYTDFRDPEGLEAYAVRARRDGFSGMLAVHPDQVDVINRAFVPTSAELERAERIIALFDEHPEAGALGMDGEMIDRPHLLQAQRIMKLAKRLAAL